MLKVVYKVGWVRSGDYGTTEETGFVCYDMYLHSSVKTSSFQVSQLVTLINLLLGELSKASRQRIMTICTIDVHARDVVQKMIVQKVENAQAFSWLSQLRHRCEGVELGRGGGRGGGEVGEDEREG